MTLRAPTKRAEYQPLSGCDGDARPGVRRVDETAAADVDADVAEPVEEEQVARSQRPARDPAAEAELRDRVVRQRDPEVREDEAGEARAVEAAARRGAAVAVTDAEQMAGVGDDASLARGRVLSCVRWRRVLRRRGRR